ncbi:hypothetical protein Tco_0862677 [Tanacetum coccineum]
MQKNCPITTHQTYDMVNGRWKNMRPKVAQFCGVYHNFTWRAVSEAKDEDYTQQSLLEYQADYRVPFTLMNAWANLKDCQKWKEVEIPNFEAKKPMMTFVPGDGVAIPSDVVIA